MSNQTTPQINTESILSAEVKAQLTEMTQREIHTYCDYATSRATVEESVQKELDTLQKGMEQVSTLGEELSENFKNKMASNSVYAGTYNNQIEQKEDAKQALAFAKICIETKEKIAGGFAQYGAVALLRTLLPSKWPKPSDAALKAKITQEAQTIAFAQKVKGGIGYFLSILAGILFIFIPMIIDKIFTLDEPLYDWFYSTVKSDLPNIVGVSVAIAAIGCIITAIFKGKKKSALAQSAVAYALQTENFTAAEKAYAELQEFYNSKSKMLKELSDAYSDASNKVMGDVINQRLLSPFPANYMNTVVIDHAINFLDTGKANSLQDVYSIFEQILQEQARKEAALKAANELLVAEQARLVAQKTQEADSETTANTQTASTPKQEQEPVDDRNYKTVVLESVRHGKLNDTSTATYIIDTQTGREYRVYNYHKNTGYFEDENSNVYYFNQYRDLDNVEYTGKYRRRTQSEWEADNR